MKVSVRLKMKRGLTDFSYSDPISAWSNYYLTEIPNLAKTKAGCGYTAGICLWVARVRILNCFFSYVEPVVWF